MDTRRDVFLLFGCDDLLNRREDMPFIFLVPMQRMSEEARKKKKKKVGIGRVNALALADSPLE
jgi:hypothetical protein